jgi:heme exporter protein D
MNWSSWQDFVAMGGYGGYVWGSFGVCAALLAAELLQLALRRRALLREAANDDDAGSEDAGHRELNA